MLAREEVVTVVRVPEKKEHLKFEICKDKDKDWQHHNTTKIFSSRTNATRNSNKTIKLCSLLNQVACNWRGLFPAVDFENLIMVNQINDTYLKL